MNHWFSSHCHLSSEVYQNAVKFWKKIIFDLIIRFLNESKLQSDAHSGFRPSESCKCQLISIVHDIYKSFDRNLSLEVKGIFLDT